jgi:hypothetical protein
MYRDRPGDACHLYSIGMSNLVPPARISVAVRRPDDEAILVLPGVSRQLHVVELNTATLPDMYDEIRRLRRDTSTLPHIDERLARMAVLLDGIDANTAAVHELAAVMTPLRGAALRVGTLSDKIAARPRRPPRRPPAP